MNNNFTILKDKSLKEVIELMNKNGQGFVCIVDDQHKVIGTITDGDIRRAVLKGEELEAKAFQIMNPQPKVINQKATKDEILTIFKTNKIRNLPVLGFDEKLIDLIHINQFLEEGIEKTDKVAVIMAGGEGKRLRPYTDKTPKPMLLVEGKPILEQIILSLKEHGYEKFYISVNYLSEVIESHFADGHKLGVQIEYLKETKKLGTAGSLSMLPESVNGPVLILNGDVVTDVNFQELLKSHIDKKADFTMAASTYKFDIPFGVLELNGENIVGVEEKPVKKYLCNAGIYMLSKKALKLVPKNEFFDMTDLLKRSISEQLDTNVFPLHECWLDVGRKEDLMKARKSNVDV